MIDLKLMPTLAPITTSSKLDAEGFLVSAVKEILLKLRVASDAIKVSIWSVLKPQGIATRVFGDAKREITHFGVAKIPTATP